MEQTEEEFKTEVKKYPNLALSVVSNKIIKDTIRHREYRDIVVK